MRAAIVERHDLDVEVVQAAVDIDILDARVGELHVPVRVRQVMLIGPFPDLGLVAIGPAVAIGAATIPLLQELLVLALQLVVQSDALDTRAALFETLGFTLIRTVDLRIVLDLASLLQFRIKPLSPVFIAAPAVPVLAVTAAAAFLPMRFQQVPAAFRQDDDAMTVTRHGHSTNEPLLAEMSQVTFAWVTGPAVVVLEVTRGNDAKDSDETQRAGFRTAKGVLAVTVADQLAFGPAREVELVDEDVSRVDRVAVACVIIPFAWIASPTGIIVKHNRNLLK